MSITLTQALTVVQGGTTIETDNAAACMAFAVSWTLVGPTAVATFQDGAVSGISLNPGTIAGLNTVQFSLNMTTGAWSTSNGLSGTISGAALNSFLTTLKSIRNTIEAEAVSLGIIAGTQVAW
jgi:hypothetical protein